MPSIMDKNLVLKKLKELQKYVDELKTFRKKGVADLKDSLSTAWAIEHGLQLSIQIVIDVGNHLLASMGENQIEDYSDVIDNLGKKRIISRRFAEKIRDMAGFRNILVHEYTEVDLKIVHTVLKKNLGDFTEFIKLIKKHVA